MDVHDGSRCRIMILGDKEVGKTTLRFKFVVHGFVESFDPTDDLRTRHMSINGEETLVEFLDIDILHRYPGLRKNLVRRSEAAILVYDITSRSSFKYIQSIYDAISETRKSTKDLKGKPYDFCLVGNKSDCCPAREVEIVEGEQLAAKLGCPYFETSAKMVENIDACLYDVVSRVRRQKDSKSSTCNKDHGVSILGCVKQIFRRRNKDYRLDTYMDQDVQKERC